jgi:hypothetical protein
MSNEATETQDRIPPIFKAASLGVVTPFWRGWVGVGFTLASGEWVSVRLEKDEALQLARLIRDHSDGFVGVEREDLSPRVTEEQVNRRVRMMLESEELFERARAKIAAIKAAGSKSSHSS